jgi:hypothetical protein
LTPGLLASATGLMRPRLTSDPKNYSLSFCDASKIFQINGKFDTAGTFDATVYSSATSAVDDSNFASAHQTPFLVPHTAETVLSSQRPGPSLAPLGRRPSASVGSPRRAVYSGSSRRRRQVRPRMPVELAPVPTPIPTKLPSFRALLFPLSTASHNSECMPAYPSPQGCVGDNLYQSWRLSESLGQLESSDSGRDRAIVTHNYEPGPDVNTSFAFSREGSNHQKETLASTSTDVVSWNEPASPHAGGKHPFQVRPENLQILPAKLYSISGSLLRNRSYMVQYEIKHGADAWKSKVWGIHIWPSETRPRGPQLDVYIYHYVNDPYRYRQSDHPYSLLRDIPPLTQWLRVRLGYSHALVKYATPTLAETLEDRCPRFSRDLVQWNLDSRNLEVLRRALNTIGDGDFVEQSITGIIDEAPWKDFLRFCHKWENSKKRQLSKHLHAEEQRASRVTAREGREGKAASFDGLKR